jgi:hypothetical protein
MAHFSAPEGMRTKRRIEEEKNFIHRSTAIGMPGICDMIVLIALFTPEFLQG